VLHIIIIIIIIKYLYLLKYYNRRPASCGVPCSSHTTAQSIPHVAAPFLFSLTAAVLTNINRRSTPFRRRHRLVFIFIRLGVLEGLTAAVAAAAGFEMSRVYVRSTAEAACILYIIIICA